jgi:hypothetical protein
MGGSEDVILLSDTLCTCGHRWDDHNDLGLCQECDCLGFTEEIE